MANYVARNYLVSLYVCMDAESYDVYLGLMAIGINGCIWLCW